MDLVLQSLSVMLMGMCGIFIVMGLISVSIALLNRFFK
ncbi:MAG: OadG-related small transporter subunit [Ruthenibacterium sp.]